MELLRVLPTPSRTRAGSESEAADCANDVGLIAESAGSKPENAVADACKTAFAEERFCESRLVDWELCAIGSTSVEPIGDCALPAFASAEPPASLDAEPPVLESEAWGRSSTSSLRLSWTAVCPAVCAVGAFVDVDK
jgi:hypothetical protein